MQWVVIQESRRDPQLGTRGTTWQSDLSVVEGKNTYRPCKAKLFVHPVTSTKGQGLFNGLEGKLSTLSHESMLFVVLPRGQRSFSNQPSLHCQHCSAFESIIVYGADKEEGKDEDSFMTTTMMLMMMLMTLTMMMLQLLLVLTQAREETMSRTMIVSQMWGC